MVFIILKLPIYSLRTGLLSKAIRGEWQIENGLHLYLDMVFCEDRNKCFLGNSQKNCLFSTKVLLEQ